MRVRDKSVAQILEDAAEIIKTHGWTTGSCVRKDANGVSYCALGAIARAAYPKTVPNDLLDTVAMEPEEYWDEFNDNGLALPKPNPRFKQAVAVAASLVDKRFASSMLDETERNRRAVYRFNDSGFRKPDDIVNLLSKAAKKAKRAKV